MSKIGQLCHPTAFQELKEKKIISILAKDKRQTVDTRHVVKEGAAIEPARWKRHQMGCGVARVHHQSLQTHGNATQ